MRRTCMIEHTMARGPSREKMRRRSRPEGKSRVRNWMWVIYFGGVVVSREVRKMDGWGRVLTWMSPEVTASMVYHAASSAIAQEASSSFVPLEYTDEADLDRASELAWLAMTLRLRRCLEDGGGAPWLKLRLKLVPGRCCMDVEPDRERLLR